MSKRTERMSRSAAERINRKDSVIRQNNIYISWEMTPTSIGGEKQAFSTVFVATLHFAFPHCL